MRPYFAECADRAEEVRRDGASVVLVTGCEMSLFANGFFPGATSMERIDNVMNGGPEHDLDLASYGVAKMLDAPATGTRYPDMPWEPKAVFDALASRNAGSTAARTTAPLRPNATG